MASVTTTRKLTAAEYLQIERAAETKSEFWNGEMFAMAGGSPVHSLIAANVIGEMHSRLKGGSCSAYTSDLRVKVEMAGAYVYPDVSVVCGEAQLEDDDILLNPIVIVEVMSDATERYDRGAKFELYRRIPSLQEYLLVSQQKPGIEQFIRQAGGAWLLQEATGLDGLLRLPTLKIQIPLADIYARVSFRALPGN